MLFINKNIFELKKPLFLSIFFIGLWNDHSARILIHVRKLHKFRWRVVSIILNIISFYVFNGIVKYWKKSYEFSLSYNEILVLNKIYLIICHVKLFKYFICFSLNTFFQIFTLSICIMHVPVCMYVRIKHMLVCFIKRHIYLLYFMHNKR